MRTESGVLFVDESGQMRSPHPGDPPETPLLGALLMPDQPRDHAALRHLVARVKAQLVSTKGSSAHFKEARHDPMALEWIAKEIHDRWCLGHPVVEVRQEDEKDFSEIVEVMPGLIESLRARLRGPRKLDLRLDNLAQRWVTAAPPHRIYLAVLFQLFQRTAKWFRANGIFPRLRVLLDEKLRKDDEGLVTFWLRFAVGAEYPAAYGERLGALLGIDPCPELQCWIRTDDDEDGIKIADIIAFARRRVVAGQDADGTYERFFAACTA